MDRFIAVLLNVVANYLTRELDLVGSRLSSGWLRWWRSPKLKPQSREQMVALLSSNEVARAITSLEAAQAPWLGAGMILMGVSLLMKTVIEPVSGAGLLHGIQVAAIVLIGLGGVLTFLSGLGYIVKARYLQSVLREVRVRMTNLAHRATG